MPSGLETVRRLRPGVYEALEVAREQAYAACPPELLELCTARIRMLIGNPVTAEGAKLGAVAHYATSSLFDDVERLALEFTEQYVMDVAGMPEELVARLHERLGTDALYALTMSLYAVDQLERLDLSACVHAGAHR